MLTTLFRTVAQKQRRWLLSNCSAGSIVNFSTQNFHCQIYSPSSLRSTCQFLQPTLPDDPLAQQQIKLTTTEDADAQDNDADQEEDIKMTENESSSFEFTAQGQFVAVYYDDGFYISQVLNIYQADQVDIIFM